MFSKAFFLILFLVFSSTFGQFCDTKSLSEENTIDPDQVPGCIIVFRKESTLKDIYRVQKSIHGYDDFIKIGEFMAITSKCNRKLRYLQYDPAVDFIEVDKTVRVQIPFFKDTQKNYVLKESEDEIQYDADWGISRISFQKRQSYYNIYRYGKSAGENVTVYVVDTGINLKHEDFEGRALPGKNTFDGGSVVDDMGHGTHVASLIAGKKYGVAKKAKVVAVKVLGSDGSGSMVSVIKGLEYALSSFQSSPNQKAIINLSLGGGKSIALNMAVNAVVKKGLYVFAAAGNEGTDACNSSPAGAEEVFTVGATEINDNPAFFSNIGKCLDIFTPGHNILGAWIGGKDASITISGTSMACPIAAGVGALLYSEGDLRQTMKKYATKNVLIDVPKNTPNLLAFNGASETSPVI